MAFNYFDKIHIFTKSRASNTQSLSHHVIKSIQYDYKGLSSVYLRTQLQKETQKIENYVQGYNVAIFTIKAPGITKSNLYFYQLEKPLTVWEDNTQTQVDIVLIIACPQIGAPEYLTAISQLSRVIKSDGITDKIRGAEDADSIRALFWDPEGNNTDGLAAA